MFFVRNLTFSANLTQIRMDSEGPGRAQGPDFLTASSEFTASESSRSYVSHPYMARQAAKIPTNHGSAAVLHEIQRIGTKQRNRSEGRNRDSKPAKAERNRAMGEIAQERRKMKA